MTTPFRFAPRAACAAALLAGPVVSIHAADTAPAHAEAEAPLTPAELARSRELEDLARDGRVVMAELAKADASPDTALPAGEKERRVTAVIARYERLVRDNPGHLDTLLLYAKFLRTAGERDLAFKVFLKADRAHPDLATVKHQIGAHLAENGEYAAALPLLRRAVELAPTEARYRYDFAEYLSACGEALAFDGVIARPERDRLMLENFDSAAALKPTEAGYRWRAAEARGEVSKPDAADALRKWEALGTLAATDAEREVTGLHRARWLIALNRTVEARRLIGESRSPGLNTTRARLKDELLKKEPGLRDPADAARASARAE